ncbi:hypothetical protein BGX26_002445 [Mortierella sp. AD094]|nr:hypothetical protein BGX26_002445 [Mortierella sp. AD094]
MDEFSKSIKLIDRAGTLAINKYASEIAEYLSTPGNQILQSAAEELELKLYDDRAARAKLRKRLFQETNFNIETSQEAGKKMVRRDATPIPKNKFIKLGYHCTTRAFHS